MMKQFEKNQLKHAEMQGNKEQIAPGETGSQKMTRKSKKQIQNQAQAGYMQSNEPQIAGGEEGKQNRSKTYTQSGKMMIKNTQDKKEISKNKSMLSEQYIYKKNIIQTRSQDGRSMIEMLGVLAIIGVLSIGGIAGYRWGMDKHVSNQILYEMNLNSAQLAMLLQKGNPDGVTLSLGSPYDDAEPRYRTVDYGFDYGCEEEVEGELHKCFNPDETGYFISALNLPERIANMVIESAPNLQYYVDYEETVADEVENKTDVTIFFDINADATESLPDSEVTQPETTKQVKCTEHTDCKPNEYCDRSIDNCRDGKPVLAASGHYCKSIENSDYTSVEVANSEGIKTTFYRSTSELDWWEAEAFCRALGNKLGDTNIHLVNLRELGCPESKNSPCPATSYGAALANELQLSDYGWTSINDSEDKCIAYNMSLTSGYVRSDKLNNLNYALCK